jgi:hypothetical protein
MKKKNYFMKKLNNRGFSVVEGLLIFVILTSIAGTGWLVWNRSSSNDSSAKSDNVITNFQECKDAGNPIQESFPEKCTANGQTFTNEAKTNEGQATDTATANWLLYEPPEKVYAVRLADGWKLYHYTDKYLQNDLGTDYPEDIIYRPGTKAKVETRTDGGRGGPTYFGLYYNKDYGKCKREGSVEQLSLKTNDGLTVAKRLYTQKGDDMFVQDGDKTYSYEVSAPGKKVCIIYDEPKGEQSKLDIVEQVVKTISFN